RIVVPGPDFAVEPEFADAARDQLRVLRAEVEDQDLVAVDVGHASGPDGIGRERISVARRSPSAPPGPPGRWPSASAARAPTSDGPRAGSRPHPPKTRWRR